jgi:hypothetical protein
MLTELHQVGWTRGPVLQYEHDERERDYLAISTLAGTANVLEAGDALNNYEYEPCAFINKFNDKAVFVEFVVPGPTKRLGSLGKFCSWPPTGFDGGGTNRVTKPPATACMGKMMVYRL